MHRRRCVTAFFLMSVHLLTLLIVIGCSQPKRPDSGGLSVVCTIFPQYDWTRQILGDMAEEVEPTLLLNKKIDLHSYQPTVNDIAEISSCDLFIYTGGESDVWVEAVLKEATNKDMVIINLLEELGAAAKIEEIKEGMEDDEEAKDAKDAEDAYDEHVWLSLKNAQSLCAVIAGALCAIDPGNAGSYMDNLAAYSEKLRSLDDEYKAAMDAASVRTLLFGDRFPFRYLCDDYGIEYYAAFPGCSAQTEASFKTIISLAEKMDELGLKTVIVTESSNMSVAGTIIENTKNKDQRIITMDSMQSVASDDILNGATYLSIMESNLSALKGALM